MAANGEEDTDRHSVPVNVVKVENAIEVRTNSVMEARGARLTRHIGPCNIGPTLQHVCL